MEYKQPAITVDLIIKYNNGIVLVKRKNPPHGWALPGGYVDYGETLENAAIREAKEETNLDVKIIRQFHAYSDPRRDPRKHVITMVFVAEGDGELRGGDDALEAKIFSLEKIPELVFDHSEIVNDYRKGTY